jgi:hypothetical protein
MIISVDYSIYHNVINAIHIKMKKSVCSNLLRDLDVRGDCRLLLLRVGDLDPALDDICGDRLHVLCVLYTRHDIPIM